METLAEHRKPRVASVIGVNAPVSAEGMAAEIVAFIAATSKSKTRTKPRASRSQDWPISQTITAHVMPWNVSAKMNIQRQRRGSSLDVSVASNLLAKRQARPSAKASRATHSKTFSVPTHGAAAAATTAAMPAIAGADDRRPRAKRWSNSMSNAMLGGRRRCELFAGVAHFGGQASARHGSPRVARNSERDGARGEIRHSLEDPLNSRCTRKSMETMVEKD